MVLTLLGGALFKALHSSRLVQTAFFTRIKRMRLRGDFYHEFRVLFFIVPDACLSGMNRRANKEAGTRSHIFKYDLAVARWMDIFLHSPDDTTGLKFLEARGNIDRH